MYTFSAIRYFLYVRKSSESEDRQVQSIEDQKAVLLRFSSTLNLTIVAEFEEAHSAKEPNTRPIFANMLKRIEKGEADGILCWNINRLSRNPVDSGRLSWMLQRGDIQSIRTVDREYRPEDNVLLMAVETATANQYIIELSKNVKRALDEKAGRGSWPLAPKPGYRSIPTVIGNKTVHRTDKAPDSFRQLRTAWDMVLTRAYTVPQILNHLDLAGFRLHATKNRPARRMRRTTLYRIFHDPFYYGYFMYKGVLCKGDHPPMVTKSEFDQVQAILKNTDSKPQKHEFAFSGLVRCGVCGCLVTAERKVKHFKTTGRTQEYVYYHCSGYRGCPKTSITEEQIHHQIAELLSAWRLDPLFMSVAQPVLNQYYGAQEQALDQTDATLRRKFLGAEERLERLFEMREAGEITALEFAKRKSTYQNEINSLDQEITAGMSRIRENAQSIGRAVAYLVDAPSRFQEPIAANKRVIAALLAKEYVLTKEKELLIVPDPLLEQIQTFEPPDGGDHQVKSGSVDDLRPTKHLKKPKAKCATFEPQEWQDHMVRSGELVGASSVQQAWLAHLRNLITGEKVSFGEATK